MSTQEQYWQGVADAIKAGRVAGAILRLEHPPVEVRADAERMAPKLKAALARGDFYGIRRPRREALSLREPRPVFWNQPRGR